MQMNVYKQVWTSMKIECSLNEILYISDHESLLS